MCLAAIIGSAVAFSAPKTGWWVDPAGAVLISAVILYRWGAIILTCIRQVDGYKAPEEVVEKVRAEGWTGRIAKGDSPVTIALMIAVCPSH